MAELTVTGLRVLREVAERGSFTAAAGPLGYTQSAVSRQIAALERAAGRPLVLRHRHGVSLTPDGGRLLARAQRVLGELDLARRELDDTAGPATPVRLGAYASAGAVLVPRALAAIAATRPEMEVTYREATTPALVRALRAGTIDLAVLGATPPFRPFDDLDPPLAVEVIAEAELLVAVPAGHPLAARAAVAPEELAGERWIASRSEAEETLLGVWPGLPGRPRVAFTVRDWLTKLGLVGAGLGITTVPAVAAEAVPSSIRLLAVRGGSQERRRTVLARRADDPPSPGLEAVADALRAGAVRFPGRAR